MGKVPLEIRRKGGRQLRQDWLMRSTTLTLMGGTKRR